MTKISNLWYAVLERIKGPKSRRSLADPLKDMPLIPSHKPLSAPGYSVVLINERRGPKQFSFTGKKVRIGIAGTVIIACLAMFGVYSVGRGLLGSNSAQDAGNTQGAANLATGPAQNYDSRGDSGLSREYSSSAGSGAEHTRSLEKQASSSEVGLSQQDSQNDVASSSIQSSEKLEGTLSASLGKMESGQNLQSSGPSRLSDNKSRTGESSSGSQVAVASNDPESSPIINFNAQDVVVKPTSVNSGTLSFRLIKDRSETLFSGYLFVFVEMRDKRGETKIYVYPDKTNLGEGDLPSNFREGENISFKYNSRVELPYGDIRAGAGLARVSILLYSDDGKIVFQRGFDRKELLVSGPSGQQRSDGAKPKQAEKRKAL